MITKLPYNDAVFWQMLNKQQRVIGGGEQRAKAVLDKSPPKVTAPAQRAANLGKRLPEAPPHQGAEASPL